MVRYLMPALMALAFFAIGGNYLLDYLRAGGGGIQGLARDQALREDLRAIAQGFDVSGLSEAVFLVQYVKEVENAEPESAMATAFLVDRACGVFATNAHVADIFSEDSKMVVRQPGTGAELPVTGVKIHPGRKMLRAALDVYGPVKEVADIAGAKQKSDVAVSEFFDGALLFTQPDAARDNCKPVQGVTLPAALRLAKLKTLDALKAGSAAAVIGYPGTGTTTSRYAMLETLPRAETGTLRAIGSDMPVNATLRRQTPILERSLFLSMQTIGGNSGSPIVAPSGEVIGILTAGTDGEDRGSIYQESIAERIDIIQDLLDGLSDDAVAAKYMAAIQARLGDYMTAEAAAAKEAREAIAATAKEFGLQETIADSQANAYSYDARAKLEYCLDDSPNSDAPICLTPAHFGVSAQRAWFARVSVEIDTTKAHILTAADFDAQVSLSEFSKRELESLALQRAAQSMCPLSIARLAEVKAGVTAESAVRAKSALRTFPHMTIAATHEGAKTIDLLVLRPSACSSDYGNAKLVVTPFELEPGPRKDQVSLTEQIGEAISQAWTQFGQSFAPSLSPKD